MIESSAQTVLATPALTSVWKRIRDELVRLQDEAPRQMAGQVVNPITGQVFSQNTACAALVFATEYRRSGEQVWRNRSEAALLALAQQPLHSGVNGPKWYRFGWEERHRRCLFTTGTLLDTYWQALRLLDTSDDTRNVPALLALLQDCRIRQGQFAHDAVPLGASAHCVQNTSAIALYLMETLAAEMDAAHAPIMADRHATCQLLLRGQRSDGLWPYVYPGTAQRWYYDYSQLRLLLKLTPRLRRRFLREGDSSIYFGDGVHHCLVLYYLAKSLVVRQPSLDWQPVLQKGWDWVLRRLLPTPGGGMRFDFDWEPFTESFRWCNFRDTSTYFLILAALPYLARLGIEKHPGPIAEGLLVHVDRELSGDPRFPTAILPYEGPERIVRFILPRIGEAAAWKGALLAEFVRLAVADGQPWVSTSTSGAPSA